MSKEYCYLVTYSIGSHGDYYDHNIFVTKDFDVAKNYVEKFNRILNKWITYYDQFEDNIWDDNIEQYIQNRYCQLYEINQATFLKIPYK